jgi:hypothetical protein
LERLNVLGYSLSPLPLQVVLVNVLLNLLRGLGLVLAVPLLPAGEVMGCDLAESRIERVGLVDELVKTKLADL